MAKVTMLLVPAANCKPSTQAGCGKTDPVRATGMPRGHLLLHNQSRESGSSAASLATHSTINTFLLDKQYIYRKLIRSRLLRASKFDTQLLPAQLHSAAASSWRLQATRPAFVPLVNFVRCCKLALLGISRAPILPPSLSFPATPHQRLLDVG